LRIRRNDERRSATPQMGVLKQPHQSLKIAPVDADVTNFAYLAR
jgi:hypothetical protein